MEKIKVERSQDKKIYVHNDLSNGALHFKKNINRMLEEGNKEGIFFENMACLMMLAFSFEAHINF